MRQTALDPNLPPGPFAVPADALGPLRVAGSRVPAPGGYPAGSGALVARLGLVSGWQLRCLLRSGFPPGAGYPPGRVAADRSLPGRLVRAGVLTAYAVESPVRLPPLYGPGPEAEPRWPFWDGPAAVNQVVANHFLIRLLPRGPVSGAAFWADYGRGLQVVRGGERFTVLSFREGGGEEERFGTFLRLYRPGEGKTVLVASSVRHLGRLSWLARSRACPVRLTWDGALFHLPLAQAFCRVGDDGPVPVLMSGLGVEDGDAGQVQKTWVEKGG